MERIITVITTLNDRGLLEKIGLHLIGKRLIACMQITGPITSIYRWRGRVEQAGEWMGIMKTREGRYEEVEREIRSLHPYEIPEIGVIAMDRILADYREWVVAETSPQSA